TYSNIGYNPPEGNVASLTYTLPCGTAGKVVPVNERRFAYDLHGNVVAEFGSGTQPAVFEFDDADNKISQKFFRAGSEVIDGDPRERGDFDETLWVYHEATGLLLAKIYPNGSRTDYAYDARNRLATTTLAREIDAAGTRLQLTRAYDDKTNELVSVTSNDGTVATSYVYNFLGQLLRMSDSSEITISYGYTEFGEVESETRSGLFNKVLTHHYDDFGREIGYSLDGERKTIISFESDTGRVSSLLAETKNFAWNYLAGTSLKSKLVYPNDAVSEWSYEEKRDLLSCVKNTINSAITSQYDYENDALGRRTVVAKSGTMFDGDDRVAVGYNNRSEVVSAVAANDNSYSYAYDFDNIGNRNSATESGTTTAYSANELNQYSDVVVEGDSFVPEYDADGNMIVVKASSGTWDVEHSGENRPTTWTKRETGEKIYMMFDALGRRTEKRVLNASGVRTLRERYVYNGFLCVQILDGDSNNAVIKEFVWDPTESVATRPLAFSHVRESLNLLYNFDGNKNVSEVFYLAEANGIGAHYDYAPFGAVCRTTRATRVTGFDAIEQNPFRFSSEFHDPELDLVYYNYRHYSPTLGRFLSRDPIEEQGGLNLYAFLRNQFGVLDVFGLDSYSTPPSAYGANLLPIPEIDPYFSSSSPNFYLNFTDLYLADPYAKNLYPGYPYTQNPYIPNQGSTTDLYLEHSYIMDPYPADLHLEDSYPEDSYTGGECPPCFAPTTYAYKPYPETTRYPENFRLPEITGGIDNTTIAVGIRNIDSVLGFLKNSGGWRFGSMPVNEWKPSSDYVDDRFISPQGFKITFCVYFNF
ncbi:MAG: RHS repeat-associated core domain-containing protein, partial [Opitutae bacterium]|nr:RHS repeat-associated core domain-containing protein [Opitutae bacterium]